MVDCCVCNSFVLLHLRLMFEHMIRWKVSNTLHYNSDNWNCNSPYIAFVDKSGHGDLSKMLCDCCGAGRYVGMHDGLLRRPCKCLQWLSKHAELGRCGIGMWLFSVFCLGERSFCLRQVNRWWQWNWVCVKQSISSDSPTNSIYLSM